MICITIKTLEELNEKRIGNHGKLRKINSRE